MSVDEIIANLEAEKFTRLQQYDETIETLEGLRDAPTPALASGQGDVPRFRPVPSIGRPASELIMEDRGSR